MLRECATWGGRIAAGAALLAVAVAQAGELEPPPEGLDARAVSRLADRNLRGERTYLEARLTLRGKPSEPPQEFQLRLWDDRAAERSFVRFVAPKQVAGSAFLKLPPNLWAYEPAEARARRLRPEERKARLFESEFRVDDLLRVSDLAADYEVRLLGVDPAQDGTVDRRAFVLEYVRPTGSPGLWSRIIAWVDEEWGAPLRQEDYRADGKLVRVIQFGDIREVQGRYLPYVWTARAPESGGRESRIDLERVDLASDIAAATFTTRNLKPPE
jgi:hypothetical protein